MATGQRYVDARSEKPFVLHIEDDDGDAYLVVRALAQSPFQVRIGRCTDGLCAINLLREVEEGTYETPDLILLDWKLPMVSGLELLKLIRASAPFEDIPVVIFTSSDVQSDKEAAAEAGCSGYFVKPIDYSEFKRVVQKICEEFLVSRVSKEPEPQQAVML